MNNLQKSQIFLSPNRVEVTVQPTNLKYKERKDISQQIQEASTG